MKTVASVGDKQYPVVTGEPGSRVVADVETPERPKRAEGRISGRVVDEQGEPLPGVRVRLAVGNTPGGRVVNSTTDRTGAFTLSGVRPGSSYTVIAESEEGQEYLTGRSAVRAPDTDVRITLAPAGGEAERVSASVRPKRVTPISEEEGLVAEEGTEEDEEEQEFEAPRVTSRKPRVNLEDLPPAPEAEAYDPPPASSPTRSGTRPAAPARGVRWRPVGATGSTNSLPRDPAESELISKAATQDPEAREAGAVALNPAAEDDGPNPLPPAIEPGEADPPEPDEPEPSRPSPRKRRSSPTLPEETDPLPPARASGRSSASSDEANPLPPAQEPGQMTVAAPARRKRAAPEPMPEAVSETPARDGNPLPPALEPAEETGPSDSVDPGSPALSPEPGFNDSASTGSDSAFLPPVVEAGEPSKPAPAPVASSNRVLSAEASPDLLAQVEATPGLLSELPAPVEADSSGLPAELPPAQEVVSGAQPVESSPFDAPPLEAAPAAGSPPVTASVADQSVFDPEPVPSEPKPESPAATGETRKRPTWSDLASLTPRSQIAPGVSRSAAPKPKARPEVARGPLTNALPTPAAARAAPPRPDHDLVYCDYDPKHRKINDFRLPDLQGRPVRFQDLDSDLVLIDFWGTWCQPCIKSIPHLVDLQERIGSSKLKVVGIACEQGPPAERTKKVADEVRRLGINYPVLMSGMDGPCPLQEALKVQAYPTLILVDRQGRIVWRDQGATPVTLARLDRFLASAGKPDSPRRY